MNRALRIVIVSILAVLMTAGCDSLGGRGSTNSFAAQGDSNATPDLAIAFLWDPTITAAENRESAGLFLRRILSSQAVPKGTHVAIIRVDADPHILFDGVKGNPDKILEAWREASTSKLIGTDQTRAFEQALGWFNAPEQSGAKCKLLIGWTDLVPDPWKDGGKLLRTAGDPAQYDWGNARALGLHVIIAGVPYELQEKLRKRWEPHFVVQPRFFGPRHDLQLADVDLQANDSLF